MSCVVITRGGFGDAWLFESFDEADNHPLVQYGDAILCDPEDILDKYSLVELPRLLGIFGNARVNELVSLPLKTDEVLSYREKKNRLKRNIGLLWDQIMEYAQPALTDPAKICEQVTSDRKQHRKESLMADKKVDTADNQTGEKTEAKTKKSRSSAFPDDAVIKMGVDKDGNAYGGDNNPKRKGSKAYDRFSCLSEGITVKQFCDKVNKKLGDEGGTRADAMGELRWCAKQNWITVEEQNF